MAPCPVAVLPVADTPAIPAAIGGDYVGGFHVPTSVAYHPGHSWLLRERKNVVRVGADEFAAALLGKVEKLELPKPGTWVRQGQKMLAFYRDGVKTEMVSPTEGEVMESSLPTPRRLNATVPSGEGPGG